jgi:putative addiction module killer protein
VPYNHKLRRFRVLTTVEFDNWLEDQTPKTRTIIKARLDLISVGHFGDHKRFEGLIELRWVNGNRLYAFNWENSVIVALYGGTKHAQVRDIKKAKKIRDEIIKGIRTL